MQSWAAGPSLKKGYVSASRRTRGSHGCLATKSSEWPCPRLFWVLSCGGREVQAVVLFMSNRARAGYTLRSPHRLHGPSLVCSIVLLIAYITFTRLVHYSGRSGQGVYHLCLSHQPALIYRSENIDHGSCISTPGVRCLLYLRYHTIGVRTYRVSGR